MERKIKIPEKMETKLEGNSLRVRKGEDEAEAKLKHPLIDLSTEDGEVLLKSRKENKKVESVLNTFESKIKNMVKGLEEGYEYKLKVVYRHFPMDVKVRDGKIEVTNFLGEKSKREADILEGVEVKVEDEEILVRGHDKEKVGQTAANIEQKVQAPTTRDRRVFEDGIYITEKS